MVRMAPRRNHATRLEMATNSRTRKALPRPSNPIRPGPVLGVPAANHKGEEMTDQTIPAGQITATITIEEIHE